MTLNSTPSANRIHIGIFGRRNAGKSSVINAITGQNLAIVSDVKGTTTDPVHKAMELLPIGPVVIIDTPGLDDVGVLGTQRIDKAMQTLNKTDVAVLVVDGSLGFTTYDEVILTQIREKEIPYLVVFNKADLGYRSQAEAQCDTNLGLSNNSGGILNPDVDDSSASCNSEASDWNNAGEKDTVGMMQDSHVLAGIPDELCIRVSTTTGEHIHELKELIAKQAKKEENIRHIVGDLVSPSDFVVLVTPIDESAPKGRLILPQQQTIRDLLEVGAITVVVQEAELAKTLAGLQHDPALVITDSQAFAAVSAIVPPHVRLTSFSILFARYKGALEVTAAGAMALDTLQDGDTVLIAEGCTHHRQCNDIGTVKLPKWVTTYTGKQLHFASTAGTEFPQDLSPYQIVIHCGGCMLNDREVKHRMKSAQAQGVPITNYGVGIAHMQGILNRCNWIMESPCSLTTVR